MKELRVTAPLLAEHRLDPRRRMAIGLNWSLDTWRKPLNRRGINVLSVSEDGLISNTQGIADTICEYIYRVKQEDLLEMIQAGMPVAAIAAFTGVPPNEIRRITPCFFGKTVLELREEVV